MSKLNRLFRRLFRRNRSGRRDGVALVIVLAFVVIITGVIIAYFSRAIANRQISNSSANQTKVALFAQGAADTIIADLQQEIVLASTAVQPVPANNPLINSGTGTTYIPLFNPPNIPAPLDMLPQLQGQKGNAFPPNLLKTSDSTAPFFNANGQASASIPTSGQSFAVAVSSTTPSLDGRSVSLARWNAHYLLPLASYYGNQSVTGDFDPATPVTPGSTANSPGFVAPDWVLVARNGANPTTLPSNLSPSLSNTGAVIGRYAFAIYHEGGLLDANVAGYPSTSATTQYAYKPALAYADLTQIGLSGTAVDAFVAWRNYASTLAPNSYTTPYPFGTTTTNNQYANNYYTAVMSNSNGFLTASGTALNNGGLPSDINGQSDRFFQSRQQLIAFMQKGLGISGTGLQVLNYLTTFSRGLDQPSFAPNLARPLIISGGATNGGNNAVGIDNLVNPSFLTVRVSGTYFRNDGTVAAVGEPLVKRRFALSKLAWLTYLGPSSNRAIPTTNPGPTDVNYDMWQLVHTYGIPASYLAQGTPANIQKYFGLVWQQDTYQAPSARSGLAAAPAFHDNEYKWYYSGHLEPGGGGSTNVSGTAGIISRIEDLPGASTPREPDFFELLKAAVCAGSKAKGSMSLTAVSQNYPSYHPFYYQTKLDTDLDYAIIQLGANIIDESKVDGYSTRIVFNDGGGIEHEFRGVENLPYIYRVNSGSLKLRMENPVITPQTKGNEEQDSPPAGQFKDTGVMLLMEVPTIWNPYDENASMGYPAPAGPGLSPLIPGSQSTNTNFRLIADSTDPDYLCPTNTSTAPSTQYYSGFAASSQENQVYSYKNYTASVANTTYTTGANGSGSPITPALNLAQPPLPNQLYPQYATLNFAVPNQLLFREPTPLAMNGFPPGSLLQMGGSGPFQEATKIQNSAGKPAYSGTAGFLSDGATNPMNLPSGAPGSNNQYYVGICAALYPVEWPWTAETTGTVGIHLSEDITLNDYSGLGGAQGDFVTYRLQYLDPNTNSSAYSGTATVDQGSPSNPNWETYDEKYNVLDCLFLSTPFGTASGNLADQADGAQGGDWETYVDPRTSRFAAPNGVDLETPVQTPGGSIKPEEPQEWADTKYGVALTERPDYNAGYCVTDGRQQNGSVMGGQYVTVAATGWTFGQPYFHQGLLSQNSPNVADDGVRFTGDSFGVNAQTPTYYSDPDGVVRGAMGIYDTALSATSMEGLPLATAYASANNPLTGSRPQVVTGPYQGQSRPYMLHRPFRSVAELGYVFSGTPWKNIDFFTPQSGDASLLDVFSANEAPVPTTNPNPLVAGVVNLNTQQAPVLEAILANAYTDEAFTSGTATTNFAPFTSNQVNAMLTSSGTSSLLAFTSSTNGRTAAAGQGPLQNASELVGRFTPNSGTFAAAYTGPSANIGNMYAQAFSSATTAVMLTMQQVDRFREAFIRPLAAVGQTRVWNLLIDVIAQTGRYPEGATNAANFLVEGEQRYWVHVAIDRFTGQVLDKQIEVVKE